VLCCAVLRLHGVLCRAGRYASGHDEGYVSVLNPDDLPLLREALATAITQVTRACLLPRYVVSAKAQSRAIQHQGVGGMHAGTEHVCLWGATSAGTSSLHLC
jgi:hypothetical protein